MPLTHARYEELCVLGAGGQGVVLRVRDREQPDTPLVAKAWKDARDLVGLSTEFALLARLRVPGLVRARDFATDAVTGAPFLVEDFAAGVELPERLAASPQAARSRELRRVLTAVARTLAGLHEAGFVHGDLKIAHVRIDDDGPRLLDLGATVDAARPRRTPGLITPGYAAPELVAGADKSAASDLYALGALVWKSLSGRAPTPGARGLTSVAPWLAPSLADVVERLLAVHPADRHEDARALLLALGSSDAPVADGASWLFGREDALSRLALDQPGVRVVSGPAGIGKSALLDEAVVRALSSGRPARRVRPVVEHPRFLRRVVDFLRGDAAALPELGARGLLAIDDVDVAPAEMVAALDLFRVRPSSVTVLVAARRPLIDARGITLGPLDASASAALLLSLGVREPSTQAELARATSGWPSSILSAVGVGSPSDDAARESVARLLPGARRCLSLVAATGGRARWAWLDQITGDEATPAVDALAHAGLVVRGDGRTLSMAAPKLADDLARVLVLRDDLERLAEIVVADPTSTAGALLAVASLDPTSRAALLDASADRARREGARATEISALTGLAERSETRSAEVVGRLERLLRDAGDTSHAPRVIAWLEEVAARSEAARPLLHRRLAERAARAGDLVAAKAEATRALDEASRLDSAADVALARGTLGFVHLSTSEWADADLQLTHSLSALARLDDADQEEVARIEHNLGVVALFRGDVVKAVAAFEGSTRAKRALGDRAGVRASLRNLGYALLRGGRAKRAAEVLDEALALASVLGQEAGRAWCLAARAEVDLALDDVDGLLRRLAEADALGESVPPPVRADLAILRAEAYVRRFDRARALAAVGTISAAARASDALIDARALLTEARARLCAVPHERRVASRLVAASLRRARAAGLVEVVNEATCFLACLRRSTIGAPAGAPLDPTDDMQADAPLWSFLSSLSAEVDPVERCLALAAAAATAVRAERAFVVLARVGEREPLVVGADLDGHAIPNASERLSGAAIDRAFASEAPNLERDVAGAAGVGARLSLARAGGALIVEHRFRADAFDHVSEPLLERLAICASLLGGALPLAPAVVRAAREREPRTPTSSEPTTMDVARPLRASYPGIVGDSPALKRALTKLELAAESDLPVLLVGETGTGKEVFARALHLLGARAGAPFVAVNCAAIADSLFEAELFGHVKGSFTGAHAGRAGLFAKAAKGTILLDEIGELSVARQASLLRVLESGVYRAVGSDEEHTQLARVIAATNRPLDEAVAVGTFRKDLLYRLQVLSIRLPPLRERVGDVPLIVKHELARARKKVTFTEAATAALKGYDWPGNVRELCHFVERIAASGAERVDVPHLPREIRRAAPKVTGVDDERKRTVEALEASAGNISHAALRLGLSRQGLKKRMQRLGL